MADWAYPNPTQPKRDTTLTPRRPIPLTTHLSACVGLLPPSSFSSYPSLPCLTTTRARLAIAPCLLLFPSQHPAFHRICSLHLQTRRLLRPPGEQQSVARCSTPSLLSCSKRQMSRTVLTFAPRHRVTQVPTTVLAAGCRAEHTRFEGLLSMDAHVYAAPPSALMSVGEEGLGGIGRGLVG